jgi:hypothetical protein
MAQCGKRHGEDRTELIVHAQTPEAPSELSADFDVARVWVVEVRARLLASSEGVPNEE